MSDSSRPHGLQPTRLFCPWDFPGKSTGVGCHGWFGLCERSNSSKVGACDLKVSRFPLGLGSCNLCMECFASFTDEELGTRLCPGTPHPLPLSGCLGDVPHAVPGLRKPVDGGSRATSILPLRPVNEASSLDRISSQLYSALSHHPLQCTLPHPAPQWEVRAEVWGWWWR